MPDRLSCDDAMLLARARLRVQDPDLKQGKVEMFTKHTTLGPIQAPWGIQGGFAVVYKFRTKSGKLRALRCYLGRIEPDTQVRYERIGVYFARHIPDITVEFKYHNQGIAITDNVPGQTQISKVYPLIEMEWVEGATLIERVDELCRKRDRAGLEDLVKQWLTILRTLQVVHMSHGDLAGNNVMVKPDGRLVLVDYDGVYIPDLAGMPQIVAGQADYQHPQMNTRPFNEHTDSFSALVIYTALLALSVQPELWNKYLQQNAHSVIDKCLLFAQQDFTDPDQSPLISELEAISDLRIREAVQELKQACNQPVEQVRFPFRITDPDFDKKQALFMLEQAIQNDDDEQIVNAWVTPLLDNYGPAQLYLARLGRARQTMQTLKLFRNALQTGVVQHIVTGYNPILDHCKSVKKEERDLLRLAQSFIDAYNNDDDAALGAVCDEIRLLNYATSFTFTLQEAQRSALAQQRQTALITFRHALVGGSIQQIVTAYDPVLDNSKFVTADERNSIQAARDFVLADQGEDDRAIIAASETIQNSVHHTRLFFTLQEQQRIALALRREAALIRFRSALASKSIQQITATYDSVLDYSHSVTSEERGLLRVARDFVQAYQNDDDQAIITASEAIQLADYSQSLTFNIQEEQRITLAQQRKTVLANFRQALTSKQIVQIVTAYDPVLVGCKNVKQEEREQFALAQDFLKAYQDDNDRELTIVWDDIQNSRYQHAFSLTQKEQERVTFAKQRITALERFRKAIAVKGKNAEQIVFAYDPILDNCKEVTQKEREQVQAARRFMNMHESILAAIQTDNDEQIASIYDEELARQFPVFTREQQERINKGVIRGKMEKALQNKDYGCAIRLAREIKMETDSHLRHAMQNFIKQFDAKIIEASLKGDEVEVRLRWPTDDLVRYAIVLWRVDRWPRNPRKEEQGTGKAWIFRRPNEQSSKTSFKVFRQMPVYLQVYLAIADESRHPPIWFYSHGHEPGSRMVTS